MTELERLVKLAWRLRIALENVSKLKGWSTDLMGMCYTASIILYSLAMSYGIKIEIGRGTGHFFILYKRDTIIDITSTQFSQPDRVAVMPLLQGEKIGNWWKLEQIDLFRGSPWSDLINTIMKEFNATSESALPPL